MEVIMIIDKAFVLEYYPLFLKGLVVTLQIAFWGCCLGIFFGTLTGVVLARRIKVLEWFATLYVTIIRGTPMLIQIAATYFLFFKYIGISISPFWSAIISIGLNSGAYVSQIVVSGINSVGKGQIEAAKTLGFNNFQIVTLIILPQAIRTVLPALGNEFVTLVKDSSLASIIGVYELSKQGEVIISRTYDAPAVYLVIGLMYLTMTTIISLFVSKLEKRMQYHVKR